MRSEALSPRTARQRRPRRGFTPGIIAQTCFSTASRSTDRRSSTAARSSPALSGCCAVLSQDCEQDKRKGRKADEEERPALFCRDIGECQHGLADTEQREGQREGHEERVARAAPEAQEEQPAYEEPERCRSGKKVDEGCQHHSSSTSQMKPQIREATAAKANPWRTSLKSTSSAHTTRSSTSTRLFPARSRKQMLLHSSRRILVRR